MAKRVATTELRGEFVFLGTGTSVGVPVVGCDCPVCSSPDPRNQRTRSGVILGLPEGNLLIDTPPDLRTQLLRERIGLVHAVLYTHEHADHIFGLDDLRLFPYYLGELLPLYCDATVEARLRKSFDYAFDPALQNYPGGGTPRLRVVRIDDAPFEVLGERATPIPLWHGRGRVLGFRFGRVAYCTDVNGIPDESWPLLEGLDVLVLDALRYTPHPTHFSLEEAVAVAARAGARRTLLTHVSHDLDFELASRQLPPGMELAYDGQRFPLV